MTRDDQRHFAGGAVRDATSGKGRYDLLPPRAIRAVARRFEQGAEKYGDRNWEQGEPIGRSYLDSGLRHAFQALQGLTDEDHLVAAAWNFLAAIETRERIRVLMWLAGTSFTISATAATTLLAKMLTGG